jgi:deoxyribose-phosphate aldolase
MKKTHEIIEQAKTFENKLPEKKNFPIPNKDEIAGWIDHTLLKPQATIEQVSELCQEAKEYRFASVCLNPVYVPQAVKELEGSGVPVGTVIGFPLGANQTHTKVAESKAAIEAGAVELDMVIPIGLLKSGEYETVYNDIRSVAETCHENNTLLKVIIENCYLDRFEKIVACLLVKEADADFVKTSTGFGSSGATVDDVALMRAVVGSLEEMGVKAAGGIRTWADAQNMIAAGATRIGASSGVEIVTEAKKES